MLDLHVVSDVQQFMPSILANGPWVHMATIQSRTTEYIVFRHYTSNHLYIEKVTNPITWTLSRIDDDSEWKEVLQFAEEAGLTKINGTIKTAMM